MRTTRAPWTGDAANSLAAGDTRTTRPHPGGPAGPGRVLWVLWPLGLALTGAHAGAGALATPLFVPLDAALIAVGVVLAAARLWDGPGRAPAAMACAVLLLGGAGYLANLVARVGVVLAGAAPAQARVETSAWEARSYLLGLPAEPSAVVLLLVWLDLLQLGYVVLTQVAVVLLAVSLGRHGWLDASIARVAAVGGSALAGVTVLAVGLAVSGGAFDVPGLERVSAPAAWTAYLLTVPFMSTLPAFLVGAGLLAPSRVPEAR